MFGSMPINKSFDTLTSEQRKEADQFFSRAIQCAKNNDMVH